MKKMVLIRKSQMADLQTVLSLWKVESILFWEIIAITVRTAVSAISEISVRNILSGKLWFTVSPKNKIGF